MDWILKQKRANALKFKKQGINTYTKPTLRYCLECEKVWEISTTGSILFYRHLPTYKLPRVKCKKCRNLSVESYEKQNGKKRGKR
jgi:hypothetical protein|tara:strand:+ start:1031 stop:1285 length:255 start_codon:yes stop_codon:yes gene_type:complete